jgi:signal transduction histidine kinase
VGDRTRLQQIWTNLLSNAIKFTEEGHVQTWIRRHGSDQWVIEVTDTGSGIPKEAQPHIFEAFVQVDGSPTRRRSGAGLGLSVAASIVELMGGQILLQSEVGQGTTFTVYLPLHMNNKVDGR